MYARNTYNLQAVVTQSLMWIVATGPSWCQKENVRELRAHFWDEQNANTVSQTWSQPLAGSVHHLDRQPAVDPPAQFVFWMPMIFLMSVLGATKKIKVTQPHWQPQDLPVGCHPANIEHVSAWKCFPFFNYNSSHHRCCFRCKGHTSLPISRRYKVFSTWTRWFLHHTSRFQFTSPFWRFKTVPTQCLEDAAFRAKVWRCPSTARVCVACAEAQSCSQGAMTNGFF